MTLKEIGTKAKSSKGSSKMWLFRDGLTDQKTPLLLYRRLLYFKGRHRFHSYF